MQSLAAAGSVGRLEPTMDLTSELELGSEHQQPLLTAPVLHPSDEGSILCHYAIMPVHLLQFADRTASIWNHTTRYNRTVVENEDVSKHLTMHGLAYPKWCRSV